MHNFLVIVRMEIEIYYFYLGTPDVKLSGVKTDIDVVAAPLGGNKYKCTYTPSIPGKTTGSQV